MQIELKRTQILEIMGLIAGQKFTDSADGVMAKKRYSRILTELQAQFAENSTMQEIMAAAAEVDSYFDGGGFPEIIGE